ncbi:MAG: uracil-DNA glycosylase [Candidatus Riflebacteria bacterium]|nr:uracil-DNA glycosylase [Candidatus Riflebacteria bacterium]
MARKKTTEKKSPGVKHERSPNLFEILTPPGQVPFHEYEVVENPDTVAASIKSSTVSTPASDSPSIFAACEPSPSDTCDSFEKIKSDAIQCKNCELYKTRNNVVMGEGPEKTMLVFIGEAPGEDEDLSGRPFVGRAGRHLDKIMQSAGIKREEVFICNILKDRPPDNRAPTQEEMTACTPFLKRQIALLQPRIIALLGNTAVKFCIGPKTPGITQIRGKWFDSIFGIPCMPMYHPSYLLRYGSREVGSPNWQMWQDIQELKKRFDEIRSE